MNKLYKRTISDDTTLVIQGGMVEIWNDLEDGGQEAVGVTYAEIPGLITELRAALSYIFDQVRMDALAIRYLLLTQGQMATKDLIEDAALRRWMVERGMVHEILNQLTEHGITGCCYDEGERVWRWTYPTPPPSLADYPEVAVVLQRESARVAK